MHHCPILCVKDGSVYSWHGVWGDREEADRAAEITDAQVCRPRHWGVEQSRSCLLGTGSCLSFWFIHTFIPFSWLWDCLFVEIVILIMINSVVCIMEISWLALIFKEEVYRWTHWSPHPLLILCLLTHIICTTHLTFYGHIAHANPSLDHGRAVRPSWAHLPRNWNHSSSRPRHTRPRMVESDLSIGLASTHHRARNQQSWSTLVGTATCTIALVTRW